jgi:uncharacterized protein YgfB (UPF0149 family)
MSATPDAWIDYRRLSEMLTRLGYPEHASGYHGLLCGTLCVEPPDEVDPRALLDAGQGPLPRPDAEGGALLQRLIEQSFETLMSAQMSFAPLLPDDEVELPLRVSALTRWCEGFLYGLASRRTIRIEALSEDVREILGDLTQFTQAGLGTEEEDEADEAAYSELVEYVRVGAQLVFMELHPRESDAGPTGGADPVTLH